MSNIHKTTSLDKATLFNHIKKHHLCTDLKLIKSISTLDDLYIELNINPFDFQISKDELANFKKIHNISCSCFGDEDYPSSFYHLENPPAIFYYSGDIDLINKNYNLSIVGTRNSSLYGEHCCRCIVESLKDYDVTFVSGLARGIDLVSHKTALANNSSSIAVIGSGLLAFAYQGEQKLYFEELKRSNLVISEFHPHEHASKSSFALRNRLIAALSNSTIVVEAPKDSGALITAEYCLKLDRSLFAIPGDLNKKSFEGSNLLLAQNKAQPIFQASKTPFILRLDYHNADSFFTKASHESKLDKIKNTIQNTFDSNSNSPKELQTSTTKNTQLDKKRLLQDIDINEITKITKKSSKENLEDPLLDLLDSGINDFDLLLFKSHYQSPTELTKHLTDLEIQGKISRRGALFVTN